MLRSFRHAILAGSVACAISGTAVVAQTPSMSTARPAWTLDDVIAAALVQAPLVEAARAQSVAAQGRRLTAGIFPNPVATYWMENGTFPGQAPTGLDRESSFYVTLPVEPLLQRGSRVARADSAVRAAQAVLTDTERRVAVDAVHAFFRVALAQADLDAVRDNLASIGQLVDYLRNRVAQGASPEVDLIRAEVERDRIETDATLTEVEWLRSLAELRSRLGAAATPGSLRVVAPDWPRDNAPLAPLSDFITAALARRPELIASRANVDAAAGAIAVERSLILRQLGASFGFKRTAGVNTMVAGLSFTLPVFDRNRGEIQRATAERLAADLESQWLERSIAGEVEAEYQAAEHLAARVSALQPVVLGRAEESRRVALGAFQEGAASLIQVLDASRALTDARLTYARLLAAAQQSLFDLSVAAGYDAMTAARLARGATVSNGHAPSGGSR